LRWAYRCAPQAYTRSRIPFRELVRIAREAPADLLNIKGVRQKQHAYLLNALREQGYLDDIAA
jgi:hypothetical protein